MRLILIAVALALSCMPTAAQCVLEQAMDQLEYYNIQLNGQVAQKIQPILDEEMAINNKAKDPNLPIGAQLSPQDVNRFNQLRFELLSLQAHKANNSGYLRDARVIARVEKIAQAVRMGRDYKDDDPEIFYYRIMLLVYVATNTNEIRQAPTQQGGCTVDTGLVSLETATMKNGNLAEASEAKNRLTAVAQRYSLKMDGPDWVERIPDLAVKKTARVDMLTVQDAIRVIEVYAL